MPIKHFIVMVASSKNVSCTEDVRIINSIFCKIYYHKYHQRRALVIPSAGEA